MPRDSNKTTAISVVTIQISDLGFDLPGLLQLQHSNVIGTQITESILKIYDRNHQSFTRLHQICTHNRVASEPPAPEEWLHDTFLI